MNVIVPAINTLRPLIPVAFSGGIMFACLHMYNGNLIREEKQPRFVRNASRATRIAMNIFTVFLCLGTLYLDKRWAVFTAVSLIWPKKVQKVANTIVEIFTNLTLPTMAFIALGEIWLKIYAAVPLTAAISWAYFGSRLVGTAKNLEKASRQPQQT